MKAHKQLKELVANAVFEDSTRAGTSTGLTSTMVNMQMKTTFFKEIPTLVQREKLSYAHKLIKRLFSSVQLPNVPRAGRLKHFVRKWQFLTKDQSILEIVKGYQILFLSQPLQQGKFISTSKKNLQWWRRLKKDAIEKVHMEKVSVKSQFVKNLFLVKKKDRGNRPVINLKNLNQYIPTTISK